MAICFTKCQIKNNIDPWTAPHGIDVAHTMRFIGEGRFVGEVLWKNHSHGMRAMTI
jgi:hypothetical protein